MLKYMVEIVNEEEDVMFTPSVVLPRVICRFVGSSARKASRKDLPTLRHSLVHISQPDMKEKEVVRYVIPA